MTILGINLIVLNLFSLLITLFFLIQKSKLTAVKQPVDAIVVIGASSCT